MTGRQWVVPGEAMSYLRGGAHLLSGMGGSTSELGLCVGNVIVTPTYHKQDLSVDDFAGVPVDCQHRLAEVNVRMRLAYFDPHLLAIAQSESVCGGPVTPDQIQPTVNGIYAADGVLGPAGMQLGKSKDPYQSGNNLMTLFVNPVQGGYPWRFIAGYLDGPVIPLGVDAQVVDVNFRAIPYARYDTSGFVGPLSHTLFEQDGPLVFCAVSGEIVSSGVVLYDHVTPSDMPPLGV